MASLHIEHQITDLDAWLAAFASFSEVRRQAGVRDERVRHPAGDPHSIVVDLEFDTVGDAASFLDFLRTQVWAVPEASPALAGSPDAKVLDDVAMARR
jgi:hypothetical protein